MNSSNIETVKRASIVGILLATLFSGLLLRIFLYETRDYDYYQAKVNDQLTTESKVAATRGNIYDRNGILLATSITTYRVFISPSAIASAQAKLKDDMTLRYDELISDNLSDILDIEYSFVYKQTTYTKYLDRTIAREVDDNTAEKIRKFIDKYSLEDMVFLEATSTRYYPYNTLASHVLGFTNNDGDGIYGIEAQYNKELEGVDGKYITARDSLGNELPYEYQSYIEAQDGNNIISTIDLQIQAYLEEQVKAAYTESGAQNRACGIVMDVNTGEILGMAVYPSYNSNDPWTLNDESQEMLDKSGYEVGSDLYTAYKSELLYRTWSNKAINDVYIPGSTFKVITSAMALEEHPDVINQKFSCNGVYPVNGWQIHCHKREGHGTLTFSGAIQQSCNPGLMQIGLNWLGTSTFYKYIKSFGYLEKTGIDLPGEGSGLFWPESEFSEINLATASFGQNFNVTVIRQLTAVAAVANGGYLVKPHVMSQITDNDSNVISEYDTTQSRQVVSSQVCKLVSEILEEGVSGNGGAKNAYVAGYRVAAKTGTSEKKDVGSEGKYICSCVAYAPADDPQVAVIIMVDEPTKGNLYGSTVAAPYVGNVLEVILPYLNVEAVYTEEELKNMATEIPSFVGWRVSALKKYQEYYESTYGIKINFFDAEEYGDEYDSRIIVRQSPEEGVRSEKKLTTVCVYTTRSAAESDTVKVPNVKGMTATAANASLINSGLNIKIEGTNSYMSGTGATAVSQSHEAGSTVPRGTVVTVTFRYLDDTDDTSNDVSR